MSTLKYAAVLNDEGVAKGLMVLFTPKGYKRCSDSVSSPVLFYVGYFEKTDMSSENGDTQEILYISKVKAGSDFFLGPDPIFIATKDFFENGVIMATYRFDKESALCEARKNSPNLKNTVRQTILRLHNKKIERVGDFDLRNSSTSKNGTAVTTSKFGWVPAQGDTYGYISVVTQLKIASTPATGAKMTPQKCATKVRVFSVMKSGKVTALTSKDLEKHAKTIAALAKLPRQSSPPSAQACTKL